MGGSLSGTSNRFVVCICHLKMKLGVAEVSNCVVRESV